MPGCQGGRCSPSTDWCLGGCLGGRDDEPAKTMTWSRFKRPRVAVLLHASSKVSKRRGGGLPERTTLKKTTLGGRPSPRKARLASYELSSSLYRATTFVRDSSHQWNSASSSIASRRSCESLRNAFAGFCTRCRMWTRSRTRTLWRKCTSCDPMRPWRTDLTPRVMLHEWGQKGRRTTTSGRGSGASLRTACGSWRSKWRRKQPPTRPTSTSRPRRERRTCLATGRQRCRPRRIFAAHCSADVQQCRANQRNRVPRHGAAAQHTCALYV